MLRIAICDDEPSVHEELHKILVDYSVYADQELKIIHFYAAETLLNSPLEYQILFLDIMLDQGFDGVEIGVQLRERNSHALFIIITSRADRTEDAYEATVFRYIIKPLSANKIYKALKAAQRYILYNSDEYLKVSYRNIDYIFHIRDVILVESYLRQRHIITKNIRQPTNETWDALLKKLENFPYFVHIGKSYYVNMHHIRTVSANSITLTNDQIINFNKHSQEKFHYAYNAFLSDQGG